MSSLGKGPGVTRLRGKNIITVVIPRPIKGQYIEVDRLKNWLIRLASCKKLIIKVSAT
jgi:hypothetical protein